MALSNTVKDTEFINKLVEMKRYYRSDTKIKELLEAADKVVSENDYADLWKWKREDFFKYLKDYFQTDQKDGSYIKITNITDSTNNDSYSINIEIAKTPISPKYSVGSEDDEIVL